MDSGRREPSPHKYWHSDASSKVWRGNICQLSWHSLTSRRPSIKSTVGNSWKFFEPMESQHALYSRSVMYTTTPRPRSWLLMVRQTPSQSSQVSCRVTPLSPTSSLSSSTTPYVVLLRGKRNNLGSQSPQGRADGSGQWYRRTSTSQMASHSCQTPSRKHRPCCSVWRASARRWAYSWMLRRLR